MGWAGVQVEAEGESIVIDHVLDVGILSAFFGEDRDSFLEPEGKVTAALVTHLHRDHADPGAIADALNDSGPLLRPRRKRVESKLDEFATGEADSGFAESGVEQRHLEPGDEAEIGPFRVTAFPAVDALGSPQVSWSVQADGGSIFHAGDTMWHGHWWDIALARGPIDLAFLPANGAELSYPQWQPAAPLPGVLTPEQAVEAARSLQARAVAPIHFNRTFEHPEYYRPVPDALDRLRKHAGERDVDLLLMQPGEWVEVSTVG
jgi:L-ascorbate metabolism protein UlaG (beta-lactamase superfamily)